MQYKPWKNYSDLFIFAIVLTGVLWLGQKTFNSLQPANRNIASHNEPTLSQIENDLNGTWINEKDNSKFIYDQTKKSLFEYSNESIETDDGQNILCSLIIKSSSPRVLPCPVSDLKCYKNGIRFPTVLDYVIDEIQTENTDKNKTDCETFAQKFYESNQKSGTVIRIPFKMDSQFKLTLDTNDVFIKQ